MVVVDRLLVVTDYYVGRYECSCAKVYYESSAIAGSL